MSVRPFYRFLPPIVAIVGFGLFCLLYLVDRSDYYPILNGFGITPFRYPFVDGEYLLVGVECWNRGVDVYVQNPCDILGRLQDYSPLWLRLTFLAGGAITTNMLGLALDSIFLLSLFWLPKPVRPRDALQLIVAVCSTMTVFALERANVDVVMFGVAVLAAVLLDRSRPARIIGYGAILGAGLLKFYPLALLALAVRERPRRFVLVACIAVLALAVFVACFLPELRQMVPNIPSGLYFNDMFGASNLPYGLTIVAGLDPVARRYPALLLLALLLVGLAYYTVRSSQRDDVRTSVEHLPKPEAMFLAVGAVLLCGCFVAGQSVAYRGIFFLLVLPGLQSLARNGATPRVRARWSTATFMILFLMWGDALRRLLSHRLHTLHVPAGPTILLELLVWGLREFVWLSVIATLGSLLLCFLRHTDQGGFARLLRRPRLGVRPASVPPRHRARG